MKFKMITPKLSICIPVAPGRKRNLALILRRLSVNRVNHPNIPFEVIVVDGGDTGNLREMCESSKAGLNIKYVYLPIYRQINPSYPRNVAMRIAEGELITFVDSDYWIGEDFIVGATAPFTNKKKAIVNLGYVANSSESARGGETAGRQINEALLTSDKDLTISSVYKITEMPKPKPAERTWLWCAPRPMVLFLNGYDENFVRGWGFEDEDIFLRLTAGPIKIHRQEYETFCCIHLWHPEEKKIDSGINEAHYTGLGPLRKSVQSNLCHQWGKLLEGSYSDINGEILDAEGHENWISENLPEINNYLNSPYWEDIQDIIK